MDKIQKIREEYREYIDNNRERMLEGVALMRDDMEHSPLFFRDEFNAKPLMIPRLFSMETKARFEEIARITCSILEKVIRQYLENESYRRLFPFSKEMEELILLSKGSASLLPLTRLDIFYNEETGDFKFCEINADGSSGMNADRLMVDMMIHNPAHQEMLYRYDMQSMELFDTWVDEFLSMYDTFTRKKNMAGTKPNVVITDFLDMGRVREFEEFTRRFQKKGVHCEICDIRELKFKEGELFTKTGHKVDAIYRRAVTLEIMERIDEVAGFLQAVKAGGIFLAGEFCTHVIDNKWTFYVLHHEETAEFLTPEEKEFVKQHIPGTFPFKEGGIKREDVIADKNKYILKPWDGYAAHGVRAGLECTQEEWEDFIANVYGTDYICQEFAKQYDSYNIDLMFGEGKWMDYSHMTGLFVYNGKFAGVIARSAPAGGIIDYYRDERRQPTFFVK